MITAALREDAAVVRQRKPWWRFVLPNILLIVICTTGVLDYFSAETQRLYVDDHSDPSKQVGSVWQHFAIRRNQVVPQIVMRDEAHLVFPLRLRLPHRLLFEVKPKGKASYEIYQTKAGKRQLLISETIEQSTRRAFPLAPGASELELLERGSVEFRDLQMARSVFLWPIYCAAAVALGFSAVQNLRARTPQVAEWTILVMTLVISFGALEALLRNFRLNLPGVIAAARTDLGLVVKDRRWIDPARYKMRLRPNLDTHAEWRFGDIARLGFISKDVCRPSLYRFPIRTDAEGFRNPTVRGVIDVAALGDSFTDGTTSAVEETWPARLEQLTGRAVQNYGTSGFGPQQANYVLRDFVLAKKPRWVILGFFSGNDLHDAEAFDDWERDEHRLGEEQTGPKLTASFRRCKTLYLWTVVRVGAESIHKAVRGGADQLNQPVLSALTDRPRFDRGMFNVPAQGRTLQFAFFPPYLQKLGTPRAAIEATRGWEITRSVLAEMKSDAEANGSAFLLLFIPSKDQVYWPLVQRSFSAQHVQQAIDFYCKYNNMPLRLEEIDANRLALNGLLRDYCAQSGIAMLDLTEPLEAEVAAGREVFFPDDTHWNEAGHAVAAREVAKFLQLHP
ncbi:MAG: hypothetical protein H0W04_03645 [Chthoniobacterales bacterium]|nr:hypothetical protein [Chthoniobacterales bacterium]